MGKMIDPEINLTDANWDKLPDGINAVKWEMKDGGIVRTASGKCFPIPEQEVYAEELVKFLNIQLKIDRGASWRVVWTQSRPKYYDRLSGLYRVAVPELIECQYLDKDGDVQFLVDMEEDVWTLLDNFSFTDVCNLCNNAYEQWRDLIDIVDPREPHMFSPTHGEVEQNPLVKIPDLF